MPRRRRASENASVRSPWSIRILRPWLFRKWERERRRRLAASGATGRPLAAGDAPPPFALPDADGRVRRSSEWIGTRRTVVWFTNLCPVCADQAVELEGFARRGELPGPVIAIHFPGGSEPSPADFRRRTGAAFPILIDDGSVGRAWTGEAVPDT